MESMAISSGHRVLYAGYILGPAKVPVYDPCPFNLL